MIRARNKMVKKRKEKSSHAASRAESERERESPPNAARKTRTGRNGTTHTARCPNRNCRQPSRRDSLLLLSSPLLPPHSLPRRRSTQCARAIARSTERTSPFPSHQPYLGLTLFLYSSPDYSSLRLIRPSTVILLTQYSRTRDHVFVPDQRPYENLVN